MQQASSNALFFVLGGVRSGKSHYAQALATNHARVAFIATAERRDDEEMKRKIDRHRAERPSEWTTFEEPLHLGGLVRSLSPSFDAILIDCLTLFAANLLETYDTDEPGLQVEIEDLCAALKAAQCKVILVSNEVGNGVVPVSSLGRRFRDLVGEINQRVAAVADPVLLMVAGLPLALKGSLPAEGGS